MNTDEPEPANESGSSSFERWKDRARQAHELVADVDFDKVAQHDPSALMQLAENQRHLHSLATDSGCLDEGDPLPGIDEQALRVARHLECLDSAGFGHRLGRVLVVREGKAAMRPLEIVPHREGLPEFDLYLAAEQGERNGAHAVFVTATEVIDAFVAVPLTQNPWQLLRQQAYVDSTELLAILRISADTSQHADPD